MLNILKPFGLFYGHLIYFVTIWNILWLFAIFFPVLVCCDKKNLATLVIISMGNCGCTFLHGDSTLHIPLRDSISRPIAPHAETMPLNTAKTSRQGTIFEYSFWLLPT
jgi:hypothetical protein